MLTKEIPDKELSAAYVNDAVYGRDYRSGLGENLTKGNKLSKCCLLIQANPVYQSLIVAAVTLHCILAEWEPTQMISKETEMKESWAFWVGLFCVVIYGIDIMLSLRYTTKRVYFSSAHRRVYVILVALITLDYLTYLIVNRMFFRLLRPCLLLVRVRAVRGTGLVILGVIPKFMQFFLILGVYIAIFAMIGVNLFIEIYARKDLSHHRHGVYHFGAFNNTGMAMLTVFVLMAGGSYPRIMIPAYHEARPVAIFYFSVIILTGEIILYAILVARIYDFYVEANKTYVKNERLKERQCLIKAYEILDCNKMGQVAYPKWVSLLRCLRPNASSSEIKKRFMKLKSLSKSHMGEMGLNCRMDSFTLVEFFHIPVVLQFTVEKSTSKSENCFQRNEVWKKVTLWCRKYNNSDILQYLGSAINIMYALILVCFWWGMKPVVTETLQLMDVTLLTIITADVIIRLCANGATTEMVIHTVVITTAICTSILSQQVQLSRRRYTKGWLYVISHLVILLRLTGFLRNTSGLTHWLRRMIPPICTLFCLIAIALFTYGVLGMEFFGFLDIRNKNKKLPAGVSLCEYGFENLGCSLLTLFQVSLGSSWYKVMNYIMGEVSAWSCLYFVFFYALMQMLVLNVISAVVVELSNVIYSDEIEAKRKENMHRRVPSRNKSFLKRKLSEEIKLSNSLNAGAATEDKRNLKTVQDSTKKETSYVANYNLRLQKSRKHQHPKSPDIELSERKVLGNWTRDITPDMTFLNAEELKIFQQEMGISVKELKPSRRRSNSTTE